MHQKQEKEAGAGIFITDVFAICRQGASEWRMSRKQAIFTRHPFALLDDPYQGWASFAWCPLFLTPSAILIHLSHDSFAVQNVAGRRRRGGSDPVVVAARVAILQVLAFLSHSVNFTPVPSLPSLCFPPFFSFPRPFSHPPKGTIDGECISSEQIAKCSLTCHSVFFSSLALPVLCLADDVCSHHQWCW